VEELRTAVTRNDDSWQEYVIDWYFLPVGELTHEEKQQVEWHGSVKEPTKSPYKLQNAYAA
jgi:hypothetical protein